MKYEFPHIEHLDQVVEAIAGKDEFMIADKVEYKVVDYRVNFTDTFPSPYHATSNDEALKFSILRECRGLVFDKNGKILSRRYHKFFNMGEKPEVDKNQVDITDSHKILEKLDGSMVSPFFVGTKLIWGSKLGETFVSTQVDDFLSSFQNSYLKFAKQLLDSGLSPIFEWCSRYNRIVIDYPTPKLVLTAIRSQVTGVYTPYHELVRIGQEFGIPTVLALDGNIHNMDQFLENTKEIQGSEGFVIRFDNGHMIKVKGEWYCNLHRIKDDISREKNVIRLILDNKVDDCFSFMLEDDQKRILEYSGLLKYNLKETANQLRDIINTARNELEQDPARTQLDEEIFKKHMKRRFAIEYVNEGIKTKKISQLQGSMLFTIWDKQLDPMDVLVEFVKDHTNTATNVDKIRHLIGNISWTENLVEE